MAWTEAELRAIAEGEAAANNSGAIPTGLPESERAAWRQGYARGWNGLGQPRQVDIPEHTFERDAWSLGWQAGWAVCKAEGQGYTGRVHEVLWNRLLKLGDVDVSRWSHPERDAYADGAAAARARLEGVPAARYRGRLLEFAQHWLGGWQDAYIELVEGDLAAARRAAEFRRQADLEEQRATAPESASDRPRSGAERQRAYRERRATAWITLSAAAHAGFREVSSRKGTSFDRTLRSVLEAALRVLNGWSEDMGAWDAEAPGGTRSSAEVRVAPAPDPAAGAAPLRTPKPAVSPTPSDVRSAAARKDSVQVEVSGQTRELLDEVCRRVARPREVVLVHMAEAMREQLARGKF